MKEYYLCVDGRRIAVAEEVYRAYMRSVWAENKRINRERGRVIHYKDCNNSGFLLQYANRAAEEEALSKMELNRLIFCLHNLPKCELDIITEIYFNNKSEKALSQELNIPRRTISYKRAKILIKLKKMIVKLEGSYAKN